jgi:hypothetical protein
MTVKKIERKDMSGDAGLRQLVELFIGIVQIPEPGKYACELTLLENGKQPVKLVTLAPTNSDDKNQVIFGQSIEMNYFFERDQNLEIKIISSSGRAPVTIVENIGNIFSYSKKGFVSKNENLHVDISIKQIKSEKKHYNFATSITDNNNNLSGQELYLVYKSFNDNKHWRGVLKTEESTNMTFMPVVMAEDDLFLGDAKRNFRIELCSHRSPYLIGHAETNIEFLTEEKTIQITNNGNLINTYINFGISVNETFSFVELLGKGLQIATMMAVDFTASNRDPHDQRSLHCITNPEPNQYERSIRQCGNVLANYDNDKLFPLLGFGGIPYGKSETEFCFPLNFKDDPNVNGINEMVNVYKNAIAHCQLSGPTYFAPLLNNLCNMIQKSNANGVYNVMMIMTDGMITDMSSTIDAIVECSYLPISIIIIGVGDANFDAMERLDGDDMPLTNSEGKGCQRDIVQFVPFKKYEGNMNKLSEEVLRELPEQIEKFYTCSKFI